MGSGFKRGRMQLNGSIMFVIFLEKFKKYVYYKALLKLLYKDNYKVIKLWNKYTLLAIHYLKWLSM